MYSSVVDSSSGELLMACLFIVSAQVIGCWPMALAATDIA